jgi:hypothetical protein
LILVYIRKGTDRQLKIVALFFPRLDKSEAPLHTGINPTGKGEKDGYFVVGKYK